MTNETLPSDLAELERALRGGPAPDPALGGCVMKAVQEELRRSTRVDFWQYAASVAAVFLLMANLSLCVSSPSQATAEVNSQRLADMMRQAEQLDLPLPKAEIRRQCILMAGGVKIMPMGRPYGTRYGKRLFPE